MNCEQVQQLMGAAVDHAIDDDQRTALDAHLAGCEECREAEAALRKQDADLLRAFQPGRDRAARLAERVIAEFDRPPASPSATSPGASWFSLLLATAIGFAGAVLVFQPWQRETRPVARPLPAAKPGAGSLEITSAARIVEATGDVQLGERSVRLSGPQAYLTCPTKERVCTSPDVRCELVTENGCVIRMDGETELSFSKGDSVELKRGQIWCRLPSDAALEIMPGASMTSGAGGAANEAFPMSCTTPSPVATFMTELQADGAVRVTAAGGEISLTTVAGAHRLKPGEAVTIAGGRVDTTAANSAVLSAVWMLPLLVKKGHYDKELNERVDQLLAGIGQTKMSTLYEQEIRNLGEFGVLPLVRYVQSPPSRQQQGRRLRAMRIVSDLAPAWLIGDLILLLDDPDADVRFLAATSLERLTELDQGCPASMWRETSAAATEARARWATWWQANRHRFPLPVVSASATAAPADAGKN